MSRISAYFAKNGVPLTSPAAAPTIRIRRQDTGALVVSGLAMTEVGDGIFSYSFTELPGVDYSFRCDGDPGASGQTTAQERYSVGGFTGLEDLGSNTRTRLWYASAAIVSGVAGAVRNVPAGAVSHMEAQTKSASQSDWASSPTTSYVVFNYEAGAATSASPASAEPATSAPADGTFSAEPYP